VRRSYFSDKDFRRNRAIAISVSLLLHGLLIVGLWLRVVQEPARSVEIQPEELSFGSSGGGGAEMANEGPPEFGPQQATQEEAPQRKMKKAEVELIQIHVIEPEIHADIAQPVPEKPKERPKPQPRKYKPKPSIIASQLPLGHVRHSGQGPGSGGGAGGGSGGGIGARQGYSIDWGGTGGRKLLSGRIPTYPKGTDKQMAVILRFLVLPDGSVDAILPTRRTDEILEHAAIVALQTWRFEALPSAVSQKSQSGKVTFSFKLEQ
jgi:TonB family protein